MSGTITSMRSSSAAADELDPAAVGGAGHADAGVALAVELRLGLLRDVVTSCLTSRASASGLSTWTTPPDSPNPRGSQVRTL